MIIEHSFLGLKPISLIFSLHVKKHLILMLLLYLSIVVDCFLFDIIIVHLLISQVIHVHLLQHLVIVSHHIWIAVVAADHVLLMVHCVVGGRGHHVLITDILLSSLLESIVYHRLFFVRSWYP